MRNEKTLITLMRKLVDLISDECKRNPGFSEKMDALLSDFSKRREPGKKSNKSKILETIPDIYAEWYARGEINFGLWLSEQSLPILHAVIRTHELDAKNRTGKWKEAKKLADFIVEKLRARLSRGNAFIRGESRDKGRSGSNNESSADEN